MEYIFVASEDLHGDLCYVRTLSSIYDYWIKNNWINKDTEIWDYIAETAYTLEEKFGYLGWTEAVKNMDFNTFNDVFAPAFVIRIEPLME